MKMREREAAPSLRRAERKLRERKRQHHCMAQSPLQAKRLHLKRERKPLWPAMLPLSLEMQPLSLER
jgi:hypothetical protein